MRFSASRSVGDDVPLHLRPDLAPLKSQCGLGVCKNCISTPRDRRWPAEHGLRAAAVAVRLGEIVGDGRRARGWLLRLANAEFDGNLSALVTDFAEEARRVRAGRPAGGRR